MNRRKSKLLLVFGLIVMVSQLGLAAPVTWEQNGHSYEVIVSGPISWNSAQAAAEGKGGYLATITSAEENQFVFNLTVNTPGAWHQAGWWIGPWLGGSDAASEGNWQWVTGEPWVYTNWLSGQPDNWEDEDYLMFWGSGSIMPTWNDGDVADSYVIEYDSITPTVKIQWGYVHTIPISKPIKDSPYFRIDTIASPAGGSFKWEILSGKDKIKFLSASEGSLANHIVIQATAASNPNEMYGDVAIKVTYTIGLQLPAEDSIYLSVVKPSSVTIHAIGPLEPYGLGGYQRTYYYQVMDQKGVPLTHWMDFDEKLKKGDSNYKKIWKHIDLRSGGGPTNENGIFPDWLSLNIGGLPSDFWANVEQQMWINGWKVATRCQIFYDTDAESVDGPCP